MTCEIQVSYVGWQPAEVSPVLGVRVPGGRLGEVAPGAAFSVMDTGSAGLRSWDNGPFLGLSAAPRNSLQASKISVRGEQALVPSSDGAAEWGPPSPL